jgi:hypothetical protein
MRSGVVRARSGRGQNAFTRGPSAFPGERLIAGALDVMTSGPVTIHLVAYRTGTNELRQRLDVARNWLIPCANDVQSFPSKGLDRIDQRDLSLDNQCAYFTYTTPMTLYVVDSTFTVTGSTSCRSASNGGTTVRT